jgi:probable phosphoglycerate mutase
MILVAMHGRAIRILLTHLLDLPLSAMDSFNHSNLCLYRLIYNYQTQRFSLDLANNTEHLTKLLVK